MNPASPRNTVIAVPNMGWIHSRLFPVLHHYANQGAKIYTPTGLKPCARARNECVRFLLEQGREWLWFIDHDTVPPMDALKHLANAGERVVTGLVPTAKVDTDGALRAFYVVAQRDAAGDMRACFQESGYRKIDRAGSACILIHGSVFLDVGEPWYEERPWRIDGKEPTGQDFVFCEKLEDAGIPLIAAFDVRCEHTKQMTV